MVTGKCNTETTTKRPRSCKSKTAVAETAVAVVAKAFVIVKARVLFGCMGIDAGTHCCKTDWEKSIAGDMLLTVLDCEKKSIVGLLKDNDFRTAYSRVPLTLFVVCENTRAVLLTVMFTWLRVQFRK